MRPELSRSATTQMLARVAPPAGAFAAVMATGIVSIAADEHGLVVVSTVLAGLAVAGLIGLAAVLMARLGAGLPPVAGRLCDPAVALPLFGAVAACAVLAARFAADGDVTDVFGAVGLLCWLALVPVAARALRGGTFAALRGGARGTWLLPAVGTAGLAITAADIAGSAGALIALGAVAEVLAIGCYVAAVALIAARARRDGLAGLLAGDSWIVVGGLAITTLAGDRLVHAAGPAGTAGDLEPWLRPVTVACWTAATVLVPVLVVAHLAQLRRCSGPPRYSVYWWAAVFPLGMYSVATRATATVFGVGVLPAVSRAFFAVALAAELLAACGLVAAAVRRVRQARG